MADLKIVLAGVHPLMDGEYPLNPGSLTNRDLHDIKRLSGIRPAEFQEAVDAADSDLMLSFAVIALRRAGKPIDEDSLWDAEAGTIVIAGEPDVLPPDEDPLSDNVSGNTPNGSSALSGSGSENVSGPQGNDPSPTGLPFLEPDTSALGT